MFRALALRQREKKGGPMLETLDYTIRIGSTQTFLYFDLYLYSAYAAHYVYNYKKYPLMVKSSLQLTKQPPTF